MPRGTANPACGLTDARLARFGSPETDQATERPGAPDRVGGEAREPRSPETRKTGIWKSGNLEIPEFRNRKAATPV
jgi:hypothetical protein